ncbi:hypothetical protein FB451DRAFT_1206479 [Mycena latifolia]|nr:hypothetical protein FB451DRAFT_1206479 [Mycena latifolia]
MGRRENRFVYISSLLHLRCTSYSYSYSLAYSMHHSVRLYHYPYRCIAVAFMLPPPRLCARPSPPCTLRRAPALLNRVAPQAAQGRAERRVLCTVRLAPRPDPLRHARVAHRASRIAYRSRTRIVHMHRPSNGLRAPPRPRPSRQPLARRRWQWLSARRRGPCSTGETAAGRTRTRQRRDGDEGVLGVIRGYSRLFTSGGECASVAVSTPLKTEVRHVTGVALRACVRGREYAAGARQPPVRRAKGAPNCIVTRNSRARRPRARRA